MTLDLTLDREGDAALYRQIAEQIKDRISDGRLPAGTRLPTVRQLAADVGVTRLTIQNAYGELQSGGWVEATVGRGTYVSNTARPASIVAAIGQDVTPDAVIGDIVQLTDIVGVRTLASASPDVALFPAHEFGQSLNAHCQDPAAANYASSQGSAPLRVQLSAWLHERGVVADPDDILVTSGVAQGLALTAQALARPGDVVAVEEPTYLGFLLSNKANLEWYIEGGRSRTGKLRPPRYGILSYVVDAFNTIEDEAAYCVPVSVTYDQQHEIGAISAEEMGASKSPESVKWLYQYAKDQSRALGRVHLRFGEPLSIGEAIETVRRDELAKAEELGVEPPTNLDRYAVPKIAFEVSHRINKVTPITPTSLVTFALLDNDDRALTLGQSQSVLNPLLEYIALRGLPLTSDVEIGETNGLLRSMDTLISEGVVNRYDGGTEPVYSINPDRVHEAGFYRNSIAHHFLTRAMVEVATLQVVKSGEDIVDGLWPAVKALEDLLKYEFFFPSSRKLADSVARETELVAPNWQNREWNAVTALDELRETPMHVAHRTIGPFLEAYEIVAIRLAERLPSRPIEPKDFIAECIGFAKMRWLQRSLHSPESISKNLFDGALKLAGNRDLISPGGEDLRLRRQAFADELRNAVALVQEIRRMANAQEGLTQEVSA